MVPFGLCAQTEEGRQSITIDELKNHMYFLASDYLDGRASYENGYQIAAEYCASQFKSIGLQTLLKDKNGNSTYFQEFPLIRKVYAKDCNVTLISSKESVTLISGRDFKIPESIGSIPKTETEVVFAGYGIEEPQYKWNDFEKLDITNKTVIVLMGTPKKNGKAVLPDSIDKKYQSIEGFRNKARKLIEKRVSQIIIVPDKELMTMAPWPVFPDRLQEDQFLYGIENQNESENSSPLFFAINPQSLNDVFKNQPYSPEGIEEKGLKGYKTFMLNDLKVKSNFSIIDVDTIYTKNVVAFLKGTDETLNMQNVAVGAHLDHLPQKDGQVCNGADDNASGSSGVLELAEALVKQPPRRSVIFILYAAEELGLIGSQHFLKTSPVSLKDIVVNVNLDMIGRTAPENEPDRAHYVMVYKEYLNDMTDIVSEVNKSGVNYPIVIEDRKNSQGGSDNASFHYKGIPNLTFFSGSHKDLHSPADDAEKIDYEKMQKITQLAYDLTCKFANQDLLKFTGK
jgi:hypothetical protein